MKREKYARERQNVVVPLCAREFGWHKSRVYRFELTMHDWQIRSLISVLPRRSPSGQPRGPW